MTDLRPCPDCQRHVAIAEPACPFCGHSLAPGVPHDPPLGRMSRAAVFATAAIAGTACGGKTPKPMDNHQVQQADAGVAPTPDAAPVQTYDRSNIPKPYGAPPARRRVV